MRTFMSHWRLSNKLIIQAHNPDQAKKKSLLHAIAILAAITISFFSGAYYKTNHQLNLSQELESITATSETQQQKILKLERQLAIASRESQVANTARNELSQWLDETRIQLQQSHDELEFYRKLSTESGQNRGFDVHRVLLQNSSDKNIYALSITLRQGMKKAKTISGSLTMSVQGILKNKPHQLNWASLSGIPEKPVFSFKYFQQISTSIHIPEGFIPQKLLISIKSKRDGKSDTLNKDIDWSQLQTPIQ